MSSSLVAAVVVNLVVVVQVDLEQEHLQLALLLVHILLPLAAELLEMVMVLHPLFHRLLL
jgi:hypothetical protein